jgi:hypothetical protein
MEEGVVGSSLLMLSGSVLRIGNAIVVNKDNNHCVGINRERLCQNYAKTTNEAESE